MWFIFNHVVGLITNYDIPVGLSADLAWRKLHSTRNQCFHHQTGFRFEEETIKVLNFEHSSVRC
jgi:hypothetical protein